MIALLLLAQTAPAVAGPPSPEEKRWEACVELAIEDPVRGIAEAERWKLAGGNFLAHQCRGLAYTRQQRWRSAGEAFDAAAREAEVARDARASNYWAQAGNAWIAAGEAARARAALNAALATGTLTGLELGEAHLDRARALVATGDLAGARADLDKALVHAAADPMAWLLSANLARRMGDIPLARQHIAQALERAGDDASVQLEAGNIAAVARDEAGAKAAWTRAAELAPDSAIGRSARAALEQFAGAD
ncbi:hypothetical protein ABS767_07615 [Sphingomonas sp. ST-64]|uniref:Tetratricopeptide repeat-containing protein n=1 Tax=Sphingomonas plantiphila TaxID=3163295 RepID=A0ABW8YKP0_9SPHN